MKAQELSQNETVAGVDAILAWEIGMGMGGQKLSMAELGRKTVEEFKASDKMPIYAVLDNVRSMHNVGSVFRTADAFLLRGIFLCGYTPRPPHREIQKTALGATESVDWYYAENIFDVIAHLKSEGCMVVAVEQTKGSLPLMHFAWNRRRPVAVIFGNEVEGVQQTVIDACDACVEIPQMGTKHSLNISVAAGIVLYTLAAENLKYASGPSES
jgi:23S rRNA (guanosine2251-2'-O)-methyltransferase